MQGGLLGRAQGADSLVNKGITPPSQGGWLMADYLSTTIWDMGYGPPATGQEREICILAIIFEKTK
jgi:hypothetical protein